MFKVSLRSLLSHKLRLALTALAIVLGVTFVAGTLVLTDTIRNTFTTIVSAADRGVAVEVRGLPQAAGETNSYLPVSASLLGPVRQVSGVQDAVGVIRRGGIAVIRNGTVVGGRGGGPMQGGNWISSAQISPYNLVSGDPPQAATDVVIDAQFARRQHLGIGDQVEITYQAGAANTFSITGIADLGGQSGASVVNFALFSTPTAQRLLETGATFDAIDLSVQSGVTDQQLAQRVSAALHGDAVTVQTGQQAASQAEQNALTTINNFIGTPLLVFAFIAVFVGSFIIVNTFSILVAQRTQELALLRALGATRGQVFRGVLIEAFLTGVFASLVGFVLGLLLASLLVRIISSSVTLTVGGDSFIGALLVGTIVTVLAAAIPARRATHIAPVAAMREAVPETGGLPRLRIGVGVALLAAGVVALLVNLYTASPTSGPNLPILGLSVLAIFLSVAFVAPAIVAPVAGVLGWPARRLRGVSGRLASDNARRNPRRTALTASALMIGLALVTAVAVLVDSVEASLDSAIDGSLSAQLLVVNERSGAFDPSVASTLRSDPRLTDIAEVRESDAVVGNLSTGVSGIDPSAIGRDLAMGMTTGAAQSIDTPGTAIVDTTLAGSAGLSLGDRVTMRFPNGDRIPLRIGGLYTPDAIVSGFLVSLATLDPHVTNPRDVVVLANPASGVSLTAAQASLLSDLARYPVLSGLTRDQYKALVSTGLNAFLNLIYVLLTLAIVIAVVGIINTLVLSVLERTREIGLLRALGMTRGQTREMVAWESLIIALFGAVLGLVVGSGLGIALVSSLHSDGLTVTAVPGGNLVIYAVAAALFGLLAAIFPAIRASRVDVLRAVTVE
jgi:putative ABC transport system permease protein